MIGDMVHKLSVTLDQQTIHDLDRWVKEGKYPNRSRAVQAAVDLLCRNARNDPGWGANWQN